MEQIALNGEAVEDYDDLVNEWAGGKHGTTCYCENCGKVFDIDDGENEDCDDIDELNRDENHVPFVETCDECVFSPWDSERFRDRKVHTIQKEQPKSKKQPQSENNKFDFIVNEKEKLNEKDC